MATGKSTQRRRRRAAPIWERGYLSHGYWLGNKRLGTVKLGRRGQWDGIYRWQAGHYIGEAVTLEEAKRSVEEAVLVGASQLSLF